MSTTFLTDTGVLTGRSLRHVVRSPDTIITTAVTPIAVMLLFVYAFSYPLIFLPFVSSAFVPTDSMPGPVAWFAENQPLTSIVDTIRALFVGQPVGGDLLTALAWLVVVLVLANALALTAYRRRRQ